MSGGGVAIDGFHYFCHSRIFSLVVWGKSVVGNRTNLMDGIRMNRNQIVIPIHCVCKEKRSGLPGRHC
jgi:hypothetical protein